MSIRLRLILALVLATGLVWLSAFLWIETSTRGKVEQVLDARLAESARMVSSLLTNRRIDVADAAAFSRALPDRGGYSRQLSCQIWSLSGELIGRSSGAPSMRLTQASEAGYSYSEIDGERWRVYAVVNERIGARIMVGDSVEVRDRLVRDVVGGLLLPAAIVLPVLAVVIFLSVTRGLAPLDRLARTLRMRQPTDFSSLPAGPAPAELRPVRDALNNLFARVARTREMERDFTAFAAHELKTPLAGLKTQAQIARIAKDDTTRETALCDIETSVARTDRLVRQLLELTAVEGAQLPEQRVELSSVVSDVASELNRLAEDREISIRIVPSEADRLPLPRILLHAAIRNLVENAVLAAPAGSDVQIHTACDPQFCIIEIVDRGTGIPDDIRRRVPQRFLRGGTGTGSGLGLAIVAVAMERLGGSLTFPDAARGQVVRLTLPRHSRRSPDG
ncbi:ATP-binding protein [uncultured Jannaschia sp.]|uniref:ATP-binding protein n=1 Tax=uncultured Jannaschia sp. TaxID=293347 RepID=UPI0026283A4D|nr:ATP-binding protein [uncultured Jannaschia sp.]